MSKEEEKIIIPIPAKDQEKYKAIIEAQEKLQASFIALQNNPEFIKSEKGRLALKKIEQLKAAYGKQKSGDVKFTMDALLREIEKITNTTRTKAKRRPPADGGVSDKQQAILDDIYQMWIKYSSMKKGKFLKEDIKLG